MIVEELKGMSPNCKFSRLGTGINRRQRNLWEYLAQGQFQMRRKGHCRMQFERVQRRHVSAKVLSNSPAATDE